MTRHLILGYGRDTEPQRILFSALSFWAWYEGDRSEAQTIIFTDRPEFFAQHLTGLPVECRNLTPEVLTELRGPQQFAHRIKVAIIEQVFSDHPGDNVLYCDSDTFFVKAVAPLLQKLQPGFSFMHTPEHRLADAVAIWTSFVPRNQEKDVKKFMKLIDGKEFAFGGKRQKFQESQMMWNAGLLGLPSAAAALMPGVMDLTEAFYEGSGWVMSEQVAFSLALQLGTELLPGDDYLFHYWGQRQKVVMDSMLATLTTQLPTTLPVAKRLAKVRALTSAWRRAVQADEARQAALLAFSRGQVMAGVKQAAKVLLANSFDVAFAKESVTALRGKQKE